jgi:hypothetical protein
VSGTNYYDGHLLNGLTNGIINNNLQIAPFVSDAFVTLFQASGSTLVQQPLYSTLLGGTNADIAYGVAVNSAGTAYVVGGTTSTNFPDTTNLNQVILPSFLLTNTVNTVVTNVFLMEINWNGANPSISYSQIFGGSGNDVARGVALDPAGNIFIVGSTTSFTNYTATNYFGSLTYTNSGNNNGSSDVFITAFKADLSALLYSADFGGQQNDFGYGIAVDPAGNAYITGQTFSSVNFPYFNAFRSVLDVNSDAFLAKIMLASPPLSLAINRSGTNVLVTWPSLPAVQFTTNTLSLAFTTNLLSTNWTVTARIPVLTNGNYTYTFNPTNPVRFYRLQQN